MITLFHGEDNYQSYLNAKKAAEKIANEANLELRIINADDLSSIEEFSINVESIDMFSGGKVILLKRLFKNKLILEYFINNFEQLLKYDLILWEEGKVDGKLKLFKLLQKVKQIFYHSTLKDWQLRDWVKEVCRLKNINVSNEQVEQLVLKASGSKWALINELKKIQIYEKARRDDIFTNEDFEILNATDAKGDIWKMLDYYGEGKNRLAYEEFLKLFRFESNVHYYIAMLNRELNLLAKILMAKESGVEYKSIGLPPFVLSKSIEKSRHFDIGKLKKMIQRLVEVDYNIKIGKLNEKVAILKFMFL